MSRAQQSTTRNRRPINVSNPPNRIDIGYTLGRDSSHIITLYWAETQPPLVTNALPDYLIDGIAVDWTIYAIGPTAMSIETTATIPLNFTLTVPPLSQAVRSPTGGFVASGDTIYDGGGSFALEASRVSPTEIDFSPLGEQGPSALAYWSGAGWQVTTPVTVPSGIAVIGATQTAVDQWRLEFASDISTETGLMCADVGTIYTLAGKRSWAGEIPISG